MRIKFHNRFIKQYYRLSLKDRQRFDNRFELFVLDMHQPSLRLHPLKGKLSGYHSINITGDLRAIIQIQSELVVFTAVGRHTQLY